MRIASELFSNKTGVPGTTKNSFDEFSFTSSSFPLIKPFLVVEGGSVVQVVFRSLRHRTFD